MSPSHTRPSSPPSGVRHQLRLQVLACNLVITAEGERILPCAICKQPIDYTMPPHKKNDPGYYTIDHVNGDPTNNDLDNLQPAHRHCNGASGGKDGGRGQRKERWRPSWGQSFNGLLTTQRGGRARAEEKSNTLTRSQIPFQGEVDSRSQAERSTQHSQKQNNEILKAALDFIRSEGQVEEQRLLAYVLLHVDAADGKVKRQLRTLSADVPDAPLRCDRGEDGELYFSERSADA